MRFGSGGQYEQTVEYLGREIERSGAEAVHDYYRKLLHSQGNSDALVKHGKQHIPILIHCNEDLNNYFLAAQAMVERKGDISKAVGLTRKLLERFPEHPLVSDMRRFECSFSRYQNADDD